VPVLLPDEQAASPAASASTAVRAARFFMSSPASAGAAEDVAAGQARWLAVQDRRPRRANSDTAWSTRWPASRTGFLAAA
jgi:hypothetical protein